MHVLTLISSIQTSLICEEFDFFKKQQGCWSFQIIEKKRPIEWTNTRSSKEVLKNLINNSLWKETRTTSELSVLVLWIASYDFAKHWKKVSNFSKAYYLKIVELCLINILHKQCCFLFFPYTPTRILSVYVFVLIKFG